MKIFIFHSPNPCTYLKIVQSFSSLFLLLLRRFSKNLMSVEGPVVLSLSLNIPEEDWERDLATFQPVVSRPLSNATADAQDTIPSGYCKHCNSSRAMPPIGHDRVNGADHPDWDSRLYHKKCWKEIQKEGGVVDLYEEDEGCPNDSIESDSSSSSSSPSERRDPRASASACRLEEEKL